MKVVLLLAAAYLGAVIVVYSLETHHLADFLDTPSHNIDPTAFWLTATVLWLTGVSVFTYVLLRLGETRWSEVSKVASVMVLLASFAALAWTLMDPSLVGYTSWLVIPIIGSVIWTATAWQSTKSSEADQTRTCH